MKEIKKGGWITEYSGDVKRFQATEYRVNGREWVNDSRTNTRQAMKSSGGHKKILVELPLGERTWWFCSRTSMICPSRIVGLEQVFRGLFVVS